MTSSSPTLPPATLPPIPCASWCESGNGHTTAWHPKDQYCMSRSTEIKLTAEPLRTYEGFAEHSMLDVHLSREGYSTRTIVNIVHNESSSHPCLTVEEAAVLHEALGRLLADAHRDSVAVD